MVELLVVAVLLALLSGILYGTLNGIMRGRGLIANEQESARTAQYVLERMTRELSSRVPVALSSREDRQQSASSSTSNPYAGFGFRGESLTGIDARQNSADADQLRFVSLNAGQSFVGELPNYGLVEIEYRLEEEPGRKGSDDAGYLLVREERPADVKNDKISKERAVAFPIADNIASLNFRFRKDGQWFSEWKDQGARVPEAVEITLSLVGDEGGGETYRTAVFLSKKQQRQ